MRICGRSTALAITPGEKCTTNNERVVCEIVLCDGGFGDDGIIRRLMQGLVSDTRRRQDRASWGSFQC